MSLSSRFSSVNLPPAYTAPPPVAAPPPQQPAPPATGMFPITTDDLDSLSLNYSLLGADIIRSGCALLQASATVTYRATSIFHRYVGKIGDLYKTDGTLKDEHKAAVVGSASQSPLPPPSLAADGDGNATAEQQQKQIMSKGNNGITIPRFGTLKELLAIGTQSDLVHTCTAAVLIATKMEQSAIRLRSIVHIFDRIDKRRRGVAVNVQVGLPPQEYSFFKSQVLAKETLILYTNSFNTVVESPHKFVHIFLNTIVKPPTTTEQSNETVNGETTTATTTCSNSNTLLHRWLASSISHCNDFCRHQSVVVLPAPLLATIAIHLAIDVAFATDALAAAKAELPSEWHVAFSGLTSDRFPEAVEYVNNLLYKESSQGRRPAAELVELFKKLLTGKPIPPPIAATAQPSVGTGAATPPPAPAGPVAADTTTVKTSDSAGTLQQPSSTGIVFEEFKPKSKRDKESKKEKKKDKSDKKEKSSKSKSKFTDVEIPGVTTAPPVVTSSGSEKMVFEEFNPKRKRAASEEDAQEKQNLGGVNDADALAAQRSRKEDQK